MSPETDRVKELCQVWNEGIETLKNSRLKDQGPPLYVLPWYVMLGAESSGKSAAVRNAKVPSPYAGMPGLDEMGPTETMQWWFLDTAVIMDTAGRFCFPEDDEGEKAWNKFTSLLCETRSQEPLNGAVVTLSADALSTKSVEELREDARKIRKRIDSLLSATGMDFPVYLVLTRCDHIAGFTEFFERVPDKARDQLLGMLQPQTKERTEAPAFFRSSFDTLLERLRSLRLSILLETGASDADQVFLLPEEFSRLDESLAAFVEALFAETPYQETPLFRGLLLSSARQMGRPFSHFLSQLGFDEEVRDIEPSDTSFFLHDFFGMLLKKDRGLSRHTRQRRGKSLRKALWAFAAWGAVCLALAVLLTFSFGNNISIIHMAQGDIKTKPKSAEGFGQMIVWLASVRDSVERVWERNREFSLPRLGLDQSERVEEKMRSKYNDNFHDRLLAPIDKTIVSNVDRLLEKSRTLHGGRPGEADLIPSKLLPEADVLPDIEVAPEEEAAPELPRVADFRGKRDMEMEVMEIEEPEPEPLDEDLVIQLAQQIDLMLGRITLLKLCLENSGCEGIEDIHRLPDFTFMASNVVTSDLTAQGRRLEAEYVSYLRWQLDEERLRTELDEQTALLNKVLSDEGFGLSWLVDFADSREWLEPATLQNYWEYDTAHLDGGDVKVAPAFTRAGWEECIEPLLNRMEDLAEDPGAFAKMREKFEERYWRSYQDQWQAFLQGFNVGTGLWTNLESRLKITPTILGSNSPYTRILADSAYELEPVMERDKDRLRPWLELLKEYVRLQDPKFQEAYLEWVKKSKAAGRVPGFFGRTVRRLSRITRALGSSFTPKEEELQSIQRFVEFDDALRDMVKQLDNKPKIQESVQEAFKEETPSGTTTVPVLKAAWCLDQLEDLMGDNLPDEAPFWNMFLWPMQYGWQTELDIVGSGLQTAWENDVLAEVSDLAGWQKLSTLLFNEQGKVWEFVNGPAAPYLQKDPAEGFVPRSLLGKSVPFKKDFLDMVSGGKRSKQHYSGGGTEESSISVGLDAKPTDVNPEAKMKVHRAAVKLVCGSKTQLMENFNYPIKKTFLWNPDECEAVEFQFDAGEVSVVKRYEGHMAFPQFLREIEDGTTTFKAEDLTPVKGDLDDIGITAITVKFKPHGHEPVLGFLNAAPEDIPETIVKEEAL